ncbi:MAG: alpha/beta hydrolase [Cyclobacteriaceae bacterium]
MQMKTMWFVLLTSLAISTETNAQFETLKSAAEEGYIDNNGVKIHYLSWGEGPLVVMLHGFPDFWYSWRYIIPTLSGTHQVVAIDLRGYNLSDKPEGVDAYRMQTLTSDLIAVIDHFKALKAILIANDWGGAIAWNVALYNPDRVDKLIACNIPFPANIGKYLASHPETGQYARDFQNDKSSPSPESLAAVLPEESQRKYYLEAFRKSNIEAMLNYYKASYPSSSSSNNSASASTLPNVQCPVLMIYGLKDKALPPGMLNDTWDRMDNNLTIHTIPDGSHFIQQEKPDEVNRVIRMWLGLK